MSSNGDRHSHIDRSIRQMARNNQPVPYQFAIHGAPESQAWNSARGPRPRQRQALPYTIGQPAEFLLSDIASYENLRFAYNNLRRFGGHAPGVDGITYSDLSGVELSDVLRQLSRRLVDHTYRPQPVKTHRIPKGDGRFRDLHLLTIVDRAVAKAVQLAIRRVVAQVAPNLTRSVLDVYDSIQRSIRESGRTQLAICDIQTCYATVPLAGVMQCYHRMLGVQTSIESGSDASTNTQLEALDDLLWIIELFVRGRSGPGTTVGLPEGTPVSPASMELWLHTNLDHELNAQCPDPSHHRYADNCTYLVRDEYEGHQTFAVADQILARHGMRLKDEKEVVDLRANRSVGLLGLIPRWTDSQLTFQIADEAYTQLGDKLGECWHYQDPKKAAVAVLRGWIESVGPALVIRSVTGNTVRRVRNIARNHDLADIDVRRWTDVAVRASEGWRLRCNTR